MPKSKKKCNFVECIRKFFDCTKHIERLEDESDYENVQRFEPLYLDWPPGAYNQCDDKYRFRRGDYGTFGMGLKFWLVEPLFGVVPGVLRTCVGFCGGKKPNPSHANCLDHAECVNVEFDPVIVTYRDLVKFFFANHDCSRRHMLSEFDSLILYHSNEQKKIAIEEYKVYQKSHRHRTCHTRVAPVRHFYVADDEHQKYILLNYPALMEALHLVVGREMIYSHRATVLNGFMSGCATLQEFENVKADLMLPPHVVIFLRKVIEANQPKVLQFPQFHNMKLRL